MSEPRTSTRADRTATGIGHVAAAVLVVLVGLSVGRSAPLAAGAEPDGASWPTWGGDGGRNMVSPEAHLPDLRDVAKVRWHELPGHPSVRWSYELSGCTYGTPTVAGGRVFVGTCLGRAKDLSEAVLCLDERTGKCLWRWAEPVQKRIDPKRPDFSYVLNDAPAIRMAGVCSSPAVDEGRVYFVSRSGKVVCVDAAGAAGARARVLWEFDLWEDPDVGARPADLFSSSVLVHGDLLYVCTSNGVDQNWRASKYPNPVSIPNPDGPSLIVLDKAAGRLVARDGERIGPGIYQGQWSSPALGRAGGRELIFFGGGDCVLYAFQALREVPKGVATLRKAWSFDCLPDEHKTRDAAGKPIDFRLGDAEIQQTLNRNDGTYVGPSQIIATPVFHEGRVYVGIGRDPRHGRGRGALHCVDAATGKAAWSYRDIEWTISTASVADGLVYAGDGSGRLHCLDAKTGEVRWVHGDGRKYRNGMVWASTLVADGKVYFPTRRQFCVLAAGPERKALCGTSFGSECTPVVANGTLYVVAGGYLWAFGRGKPARTNPPGKPGRR